jgi:hypothetical protein
MEGGVITGDEDGGSLEAQPSKGQMVMIFLRLGKTRSVGR